MNDLDRLIRRVQIGAVLFIATVAVVGVCSARLRIVITMMNAPVVPAAPTVATTSR